MVSVCTVPAREGRSCEHFGGYRTINRIPLPLPLLRENGSFALMAVWSKALPLTASYLSPLTGFESLPEHVSK